MLKTLFNFQIFSMAAVLHTNRYISLKASIIYNYTYPISGVITLIVNITFVETFLL